MPLKDQEAFGSIDDAVVVWLRETDCSRVADLEKPLLGDSAPDALIQRIKRFNGHDASTTGPTKTSRQRPPVVGSRGRRTITRPFDAACR